MCYDAQASQMNQKFVKPFKAGRLTAASRCIRSSALTLDPEAYTLRPKP